MQSPVRLVRNPELGVHEARRQRVDVLQGRGPRLARLAVGLQVTLGLVRDGA